jgi:hypothetical protein
MKKISCDALFSCDSEYHNINLFEIRERVEKNCFVGRPQQLLTLLGTLLLGIQWCVRKSENTVRIAIICLIRPENLVEFGFQTTEQSQF